MFRIEEKENSLLISFVGSEEELNDLMERVELGEVNGDNFGELCEENMGVGSPFCNGWFFGNGNNYPIGLTSAPFIVNGYPFDEEDNFSLEGLNLYYYNMYPIQDFLGILLWVGEVEFEKA